MNNENEIMNLPAALEYIEKNHVKISGTILRGVVSRGEIDYMRAGKLFKFRKEALDKWIKDQTFEAKADATIQA